MFGVIDRRFQRRRFRLVEPAHDRWVVLTRRPWRHVKRRHRVNDLARQLLQSDPFDDRVADWELRGFVEHDRMSDRITAPECMKSAHSGVPACISCRLGRSARPARRPATESARWSDRSDAERPESRSLQMSGSPGRRGRRQDLQKGNPAPIFREHARRKPSRRARRIDWCGVFATTPGWP